MLASKKNIKTLPKLLLLLILLLIADKVLAIENSKALILAVHPYLNSQELKKRFTPLAKYLSTELGQEVLVRLGRNYEEHLQAICHDEVDIAFVGPAPYIKLSSRSQSISLLSKLSIQGQPGYRGHIITHKDSNIQNMEDLLGKSFAFGDPNSTMSHLVPRYMLQDIGISKDDLGYSQFLYSHRNVAHAVLAGDFAAGAIKHEVFQEFADKGLREVAITPLIPTHLFVASHTLADLLVNKIKQAMLKINQTKEGLLALKAIHWQLNALVPVKDSDYQQLRLMLETISTE